MSALPPCTVTLVTTVRNGEATLAEAIESVRQQDFDDWELIVWDDGSSDDSASIIQTHAQDDPRIRAFSSEAIGRRAALTRAHAQTRGEFVGWLDADDRLAPGALERTVAFLRENPACGMVYTDHLLIDEDGEVLQQGRRSQIPYSAQRLLIDFMTFHFRLFRRAVFDEAGGINPDLEIAIDYDLCLRVSEVTQIRCLAEPLYFYRRHPEQMSLTRHEEQMSASETAIRSALERRGQVQDWALEVSDGRFRLRSLSGAVTKQGGRRPGLTRALLATVFESLRPTRDAERPVRSATCWPMAKTDVYRGVLQAATHARGIDLHFPAAPLASLMRIVWPGRTGDALLVYGFDEIISSEERGAALANAYLFEKTLDHAHARGSRVVWVVDDVLSDEGRHPEIRGRLRDFLLSKADRIVVRSYAERDALRDCVPQAEGRVVVSPHPHYVGVLPDVSSDFARAELELPEVPGTTFLLYGALRSTTTVTDLFAALDELGITQQSQVVVVCPDATPSVKQDLLKIVARNSALQLKLGSVSFRRLGMYFRLADIAVMPTRDAFAWNQLLLAMSMKKPVLAPAYPNLVEVLPATNFLFGGGDAFDAGALRREVEMASESATKLGEIGQSNIALVGRWSQDQELEALCGSI